MKVNDANTRPVTAFTALLDQLRYPYHRAGVTEIIDSYCGMACDNDATDPQAYAFGGGHDSGCCNAIVQAVGAEACLDDEGQVHQSGEFAAGVHDTAR